MTTCENCGSADVVKEGWRYNSSVKKQKFFCHKCKKWFVHDDGFKKMKTESRHITRALDEYADGASLKTVQKHLWQHDGVKVSRWTIRMWVVKYVHLFKKPKRDLVFRRLRVESITTRNTSG